jgi:hypothetical protein
MRKLAEHTGLIAVTTALTSVVVTLFLTIPKAEEWLHDFAGVANVLLLLLGLLIGAFLAFVTRTISKHPTPLKVALVGQPKAGKTVFLTMLFDQLQLIRTGSVTFQPYGRETIEQVAANLNLLSSGNWLKPTSIDSVFFFRANASISTGLFKKRYTAEIGDYAGERVEEFDSSSNQWLHRTEFFKYVIGCDAVLLAVDSAKIVKAKLTRDASIAVEMENALIAALQVIIDESGVAADRKLRKPIAITILKSDMLVRAGIEEDAALSYISRLETICKNRCRYYATFFVSAVGPVNSENSPPSSLNPTNICEPMLWVLKTVVV